MEKKAKHFVALLVRKFVDDELPQDDWSDVYTTAVKSLKPGKLRVELEQHSQHYQAQFERQFRGLTERPTSKDAKLKICCHKTARRLSQLKAESPDFQQLTAQLRQVKHFKKLLHPELRALCGFLCGKTDLDSLISVMFLTLSAIQPDVEKMLDAGDLERCSQLQKELRLMLVFFHIKKNLLAMDTKLDPSSDKRKYQDVMASLLSLFVDLSVVMSRCEDKQTYGTEMCAFVSQLLAPDHNRIIDVLLQLSAVTDSDAHTILPLARKCLTTPPLKPDHKTYTKYIACAKTIGSLLGEAAADITQAAECLKAPKNYLPWLRNQNAEVVENLPEDRKSKGCIVSRFLMREADADLIESLLDILTEEFPSPGETAELSEAVENPTMEESAEVPLFFLDTKGDDKKIPADVTEENSGKEPPDAVDGPHSDGVEVIEVDLSGFDLKKTQNGGNVDLDHVVDLDPSESEAEQSENSGMGVESEEDEIDQEDSGFIRLSSDTGTENDVLHISDDETEDKVIRISSSSELETDTLPDLRSELETDTLPDLHVEESESRSTETQKPQKLDETSPAIPEQKPEFSPLKVTRMRTRSVSSVEDESLKSKQDEGLSRKRNSPKSESLDTPEAVQENTRRQRRSTGTASCHFCSEPHSNNDCSAAAAEMPSEASVSNSKKQKLETVIKKVSDNARRHSGEQVPSRQSRGTPASMRRKSLPSQLKRYNLRKKSMH